MTIDLRLAQYRPLARAMARKHASRFRTISTEDLFAEAMIAIWGCCGKWREDTNRTFGLYAQRAIENAFDNLRTRERTKKRDFVTVSMHLTDESEDGEFLWEFQSPYPGQEWLLDRKRELERLAAIKRPAEQVLVARLRGDSLADIGKARGVSRQRAKQLEAAALRAQRRRHREAA